MAGCTFAFGQQLHSSWLPLEIKKQGFHTKPFLELQIRSCQASIPAVKEGSETRGRPSIELVYPPSIQRGLGQFPKTKKSSDNALFTSFKKVVAEVAKLIPDVSRGYQPLVDAVNGLERAMENLSDQELRMKTGEFKARLAAGQTLEMIQAEAFAVVREAAKRTVGLRHFDVQIIGGAVLHDGAIAEMQTGEGKTLVATLPAYLNALTGQGVHIVTVNDYLAARDAASMGQIYSFLGLTVGCLQVDSNPTSRREAYRADITFGTNAELGFDYLRDNTAMYKEDCVQRPGEHKFNFAIIDEADSVLIDTCQIPLIISMPGGAGDIIKHQMAATTVQRMSPKAGHYVVRAKEETVELLDEGVRFAAIFGRLGRQVAEAKMRSLWDSSNPWGHYIMRALEAKELKRRGVDYIVTPDDAQVVLIDQLTGRTLEGQRFSGGLHQALEAKEGVRIQGADRFRALMTYQSLFRQYGKLSGMTGTAKTEEKEFLSVFKLPVVVVPTHRPRVRIDLPMRFYQQESEKWKGVLEDVIAMNGLGRPVLVGTTSLQESEYLSRLLTQQGVPHALLNALPEYVKREAEIIAQAGRRGAVTISTNMAGRGTDIILGGNPGVLAVQVLLGAVIPGLCGRAAAAELQPFKLQKRTEALVDRALRQARAQFGSRLELEEAEELIREATRKTPPHGQSQAPLMGLLTMAYQSILQECREQCAKEGAAVKALGGLHVIGTHLNESRRVDNQLRGRAGRQGDPGSSRFLVSLEDEVMRRHLGKSLTAQVAKLANREAARAQQQQQNTDKGISSRPLEHATSTLQPKIERMKFEVRQEVLKFDELLDEQRNFVYNLRAAVLNEGPSDLRRRIFRYMQEVVDELVERFCSPAQGPSEWDFGALARALNDVVSHEGEEVVSEARLQGALDSGRLLFGTPMQDYSSLMAATQRRKTQRPLREGRLGEEVQQVRAVLGESLIQHYRAGLEKLQPIRTRHVVDRPSEGRFEHRVQQDWGVQLATSSPPPPSAQANIGTGGAVLSTRDEGADVATSGREEEVGEFNDSLYKLATSSERRLVLELLDTHWVSHLNRVQRLQRAVNLRRFGQLDPLEEYRLEAFQSLHSMLKSFRKTVVSGLFQDVASAGSASRRHP